MDQLYSTVIKIGIGASFIVVWLAVLCFIAYQIVRACRKNDEIIKKGIQRYIPGAIGVVVVSIFFQRLAIELYICTTDPSNQLTVFESLGKSVLHTLLIVGTYEEFTQYILIGKEMMFNLFQSRLFVLAYDIHVTLLTVMAPVLGYAVVIDALTKMFPKFKYYLSFLNRHFYFSELNERSLALAESITKEKFAWYQRPVLVFTDTYIDDEVEQSAELLIRAKNLGALCLSDDLLHMQYFSIRKKYYFLIDENETDNIDSLAELTSEKYYKSMRNSFIYVFYQDESYEMTEKKITSRLEKNVTEGFAKQIVKKTAKNRKSILKKYSKLKKNTVLPQEKKKEVRKKLRLRNPKNEAIDSFIPVIKRIRYYENLVYNLLEEIPLIEPVTTQKVDCNRRESEFNLTILGNGEIGTQMFLSSTWCGQFYGYKLCINVASTDDKEIAMGKIDKINPEILESARKESEILKIFSGDKDNEYSDPYFTFRYAKADLDKCNFKKLIFTNPFDVKDTHGILESQYYFVALGSDELNIAVAENLARMIKAEEINQKQSRNAVIVMVVFNPYLRKLFENNNKGGVTIRAYGSIEEAYSWQNITMDRLDPYARQLNNDYRRMSVSEARHETRKTRTDAYNYWSTVSRRVHHKYRMFSAFKYLEATEGTAPKTNWQYDIEDYRNYNDLIKKGEAEQKRTGGAGSDFYAYLTWLEHRRWNAYIRSIGYTRRIDMKGKNVDLKLHHCLVECKKEPVYIYHPLSQNRPDLLDEVGVVCDRDYKKYDRPKVETEYMNEDEAAQILKISKYKLRKMCENGYIPDAIKLDKNNKWIIPCKQVQE